MSLRFSCVFSMLFVLFLMLAGCGEDDENACENVDCYEHAACDSTTGECVCDDGYENWTDGTGCTEIVTDLCENVDCYDNAACDSTTGNCICDNGYENWVDGTGCTEIVTDLCENVDCYDNAACDSTTGNCICDNGYENWVDGTGCTEIVADLCENVDCYDNATCDSTTGNCICDDGYENWVDGTGCTEIVTDLCENVDCYEHAACDSTTGDCMCDDGYENWTDGTGCTEIVTDLCENVDCYDNATCDSTTGECVCDDGYENWVDGTGCTEIVTDLCENVDCYEHAACDSTTGDCMCDDGYENWTDGTGCTAIEPLAIVGEYIDNYDSRHTITYNSWTQGMGDTASLFHISQYDNDAMWMVTQNDSENAWSADLWSRFDWTWHEGELWYCQTTYDSATEADALNTAAADATDPANGGCNGFSWSKLMPWPVFDLVGEYIDNYDTRHTITYNSWTQGMGDTASLFHISQYDNDAMWMVAQNDSENAWSADLWSRFDWTWHEGELWYCQTTYDAATEDDALAATAADATDPAAGGCNGFSWSKLMPWPVFDLVGEYIDNYDTRHTITYNSWTQGEGDSASLFHISQYDNDAMWMVAQNNSENAWNSDLWSRFDWTWHEGELWYCQTTYDAATEDDALATAAADATDPANGGCNGFSWSKLTEME